MLIEGAFQGNDLFLQGEGEKVSHGALWIMSSSLLVQSPYLVWRLPQQEKTSTSVLSKEIVQQLQAIAMKELIFQHVFTLAADGGKYGQDESVPGIEGLSPLFDKSRVTCCASKTLFLVRVPGV